MKSETAFEEMQKHYQQRDLAAREWKGKGGKVVGYFCDAVPEEIILAAGFFPIRLSGDPNGDTEVARQNVIPRFTAREGFVHSMLNMLLTGQYDFLDYLVIPHTRDSIHRLYQLMAMLKESNPALTLPELFFLDSVHTTFFSGGLYNRDRMLELKERLEEWSGKEIASEALSRAIAVTNENKALLKRVAALRAADPPRISGVEALQIIGSSMFMLKEEHNRLLREYLDGADKFPVRNGTRLFVSGSPLDSLQLFEIIESCEATVVADDNCWGNRYSDVPIDTSLAPFEAIADRYHNRSPCSRMYPMSRRVEYCLQSVLEARAQGVIFNVFRNDAAEVWEIPDKTKALEDKGIPSICFRNQPYLISEPEPLKASVEKLIETIQGNR
ncbi:MAG TPA: 2-hydroxyacyl-CoA dehydratase [Dehalococcoidia bacterium]|nr:2-hydroxyacyl-CoA dehydratase [Dehalococcoidia bacterium]